MTTKKAKKTETKVEPKAEAKQADVRPVGQLYALGEAKYNPRVEHNAVAWDNVKFAIAKNKGQATHAQLCEALAEHHKKTGEHHHDFIGYMVRRGSLKVLEK